MIQRTNIIGGFVVAASVLTGLAGCNSAGVGDPNIRHYEQNTVDATNPRARLVLGSKDLPGRIALTDARIGSAGDLAKAEVTVQNLSNDRYTLEYQYAWEDRDGFSIAENRVWNRFVLAPREIKSFKSVASNPKAYAFTLTVRLPDDFFIHQEQYLERR